MNYWKNFREKHAEKIEFWKKIYGAAARFRVTLGLSLAMTVVAQVVGFLPMLAGKAFFDVVGEELKVGGVSGTGLAVSAAIVTLVVSRYVGCQVSQVSTYLSDFLHNQTNLRLDGLTSDHLLRLPLGFHFKHDTAKKLTVVSKGLVGIHNIVWYLLVQMIPVALQALVIVLWTLWIAPMPAVVMALVVAVNVVHFLGEQKKIRSARKEFNDADNVAYAIKHDVFRNIRGVKASGSERLVLSGLLTTNEELFALSKAFSWRQFKIGSAQYLLQNLAIGAVLVATVWEMRQGRATLGTVTLLFSCADRLIGSTQNALRGIDKIEESRPTAAELFDFLDEVSDVLPPEHPVPLGRMRGEIAFENVSFAYPDTTGTIRNVSFHVPAGKTVAIVGKSGAGKTTLTTLLLRGFDPNVGCVRVDGIDLRDLDLAEYLAQVGTVAQGAGLFSRTVRENIAFGIENATQDMIENAARMAGAHEFVLALTDGYETQVGEGGMKLSGGQAQRLVIARAMLRDPRLLILDEATSHLDVETEAQIMEEIVKRIKGTRTVLIIAHRLSTIRNADIVIVLDQGRIVQQGPYDKVRNEPGPFARMVELQLENASL